jgi:hypothetical protein
MVLEGCMVRVTIQDREQTVSFLLDEEAARRVVAACTSDPAGLGDLLAAADLYQQGLAVGVMARLMEFDKALQREGPAFVQRAIAQARAAGRPLEMAFQVVDPATEAESLAARGCDVLHIDLVRRSLVVSGGFVVAPMGKVRIHDGRAETDRVVTYVLPQTWRIGTR